MPHVAGSDMAKHFLSRISIYRNAKQVWFYLLPVVSFSDVIVSAAIDPFETKLSPSRLSRLIAGTALAVAAIAGANILVLAQSYQSALALGLVTSSIVALVVVAACLLARSWKQRDQLGAARAELTELDKVRALAEAELFRQSDVAEQSIRLKVALENMPHGICMFDSDQQLIVCNQKYVDVYGLSKEQARTGAHIKSILEHQTSVINVTGSPEEYVDGRVDDIAARKIYQPHPQVSRRAVDHGHA